MKHLLRIAALLGLLSQPAVGTILMPLPAPQDDPQIRYPLSQRQELKPSAAELWDVVENRICPLGRAGIDRVFGPALREPPKDMVLPIFAPDDVWVDGTCSEFHAIGELGYIECYYSVNGDTNALLQWGWFHRANDKFVPIKSAVDFDKRLDWDKAELAGLIKWLDDHLPKFKDLGIVEVSASAPARVILANGEDCTITVEIGTGPASTNYYYHAVVTTGTGSKTIRKPLRKPREEIGFSAGDDCYAATLSLTPSQFMDLGKVEFLEGTPMPLDLGGGRRCDVTASRGLNGAGVSLKFSYASPQPVLTHQTWVNASGDSLCFTTDGLVFKLTPVLRTK